MLYIGGRNRSSTLHANTSVYFGSVRGRDCDVMWGSCQPREKMKCWQILPRSARGRLYPIFLAHWASRACIMYERARLYWGGRRGVYGGLTRLGDERTFRSVRVIDEWLSQRASENTHWQTASKSDWIHNKLKEFVNSCSKQCDYAASFS